MDPLRKLVADRLRKQTAGAPHPDAEALSAFAENALAPAARQTVMVHLASCADCREVLFLSAPQAAATQQVLSVPKPRFRFALRWGTLAACVVIGAVFLVSRRGNDRTEQMAKYSPATPATAPASQPKTQTEIAMDKRPAELDAMRDRAIAPKIAAPAAVTRGHAEPKDITAKPQAALTFEKSGEVSLDESKALNAKVERQTVQALPMQGRSVNELARVSPGAAPPAPTTLGGPVKSDVVGGVVGGNAASQGYVASNAPAQPQKEMAFHGYAAGKVVDPGGAAIANAKVTAVGPAGEKTATSDASGKFSFDQLPPGTYSFKADAPGFRETQVAQVAVLADKPASMDLKLQPGAMAETVSVEAAAAPAATVSSQAGDLVATENETAISILQTRAKAQTTTETAELKKQKTSNTRKLASAGMSSLSIPVWQWALTVQGAVQRSSDGGKTWQPVPVAEGTTFRVISSVGARVWAGGSSGLLYHSNDFGQHWAQVVPTANGEKLQADITAIRFSDPLHGTINTSNGPSWTTADGGQTWSVK